MSRLDEVQFVASLSLFEDSPRELDGVFFHIVDCRSRSGFGKDSPCGLCFPDRSELLWGLQRDHKVSPYF